MVEIITIKKPEVVYIVCERHKSRPRLSLDVCHGRECRLSCENYLRAAQEGDENEV